MSQNDSIGPGSGSLHIKLLFWTTLGGRWGEGWWRGGTRINGIGSCALGSWLRACIFISCINKSQYMQMNLIMKRGTRIHRVIPVGEQMNLWMASLVVVIVVWGWQRVDGLSRVKSDSDSEVDMFSYLESFQACVLPAGLVESDIGYILTWHVWGYSFQQCQVSYNRFPYKTGMCEGYSELY